MLLNQIRLDANVNVFEVRVDIKCFRTRLPGTVAGLLHTTKGHVGFAAVSAGVGHRNPRLHRVTTALAAEQPESALNASPLGAFVPSGVIQFLNFALVRTKRPPVLLVSYQTSRQTPSISLPMVFPSIAQSKRPIRPLW